MSCICIINRTIEWSLPEVRRTLYEKVIHHFLKVYYTIDRVSMIICSLSLYFVTGCVHGLAIDFRQRVKH